MLIHLNRLSSGKVLHVAPPYLNWILPGTLISRQSQTTKRIHLFAIQFPFIPVFLITYLLRVDTNSESGIKFNYPHFRSLLLVVSTQEALASSNNSIKTIKLFIQQLWSYRSNPNTDVNDSPLRVDPSIFTVWNSFVTDTSLTWRVQRGC